MKKLSLLIAVITVFAVIACACSTKGGTGDGTTEPAATSGDEFADNVPMDLKYNGYEFVMAFPNPADHGLDYQIIDDGSVASQIDTAIYNRNRQIEGRFDITISGLTAGLSDTQTSFFIDAILSGEDAVDLAYIAFTFSGIPWITSGYAMPWNNIEYIDTDRVYWNQSIIDNLAVDGKYFLIQGDLNWPSMISTQVVFFNSNVAKEYQVENLYDAVNAGTWTFDKMRTIAKGISQDLNNDGKFDENDKFGITMCYYGAVYEIGIAANYITVAQDDGRLKMNVDTEKFADIVNYAIDLIYSEGTTYIERYDYVTESKGIGIFFDDRSLFMLTGLGTGDHFRNEMSDYGIIPWPKWDENQEKYCTTNDQWGLSCSIPKSATNTARTGAITEALCALSGKLVYPTYYEKVLSIRNTRDEESKKMLDLIFSNIIFDPGIAFGTRETYIPLNKLVKDKSNNLASWSAKYSKKIQAQFDELYDYVKQNYN